MERLTELTRGMQLMLAAGVLLLIDTFFHWQEVSASIGGIKIASAGVTAWHGFWGFFMCLALLVLLAWIAARLAGVKIPMPFSETLLAAGLAAIVLLFAVIKNLADDYSTKWSYIGIVLAGAVALGAWWQVEAAGGVETLRSEVSAMTASSSEPASAPAAPEASPPPAAAPPAHDEPSAPPVAGEPAS